MSEQYFTKEPDADHDIRWLQFSFQGRHYTFKTDAGVFSRSRIDKGSRILLSAIEVCSGDHILDLGCGYGVLGIVAADLGENTSLVLLDINRRAVRLARENAERNELESFRTVAGDGFASVSGEEFDLILTNPPLRAGKKQVLSLLYDSLQHLTPGGRLYFVIRTKQGAKSYAAALSERCTVETVTKEAGYRVFRASSD